MAEIDQGKLKSLFFQARELETEKRADFLSEACGEDGGCENVDGGRNA